MLPKPAYPIGCIAIDEQCHYNALYNRCETELRISVAKEIDKAVFDALYAWGKAAGYINIDECGCAEPKKVIINDPATVVFFSDDSKVVAKAKDGDEYDPLFGIMACALRKVGKNRVRIDAWEPVIDFLSSYLADANECRVIADMLNTTADALELDGVMDAMEEYDVRKAEEPHIEWVTPKDIAYRDFSEDKLHERERTRQTVRNLIDRGEL